jgi:nitrogen regulatory protein P-II 1
MEHQMKLVTAIINPRRLGEVKTALDLFGFRRVTISEASGRIDDRIELYRGSEYVVDTAPVVRVEVVCDLFDAEDVAGVIVSAAGNGGSDDGMVWISDVDRVIRIASRGIDMSSR